MTARALAAQEFIAVFEFVADVFGRAVALLDARVQAARRRYVECRCTGVLAA